MRAPRYALSTDRQALLDGVPLEPFELALLCLVRLTPDGATESDLLLRLTPDATPADGRRRIQAGLAGINRAAGTELVLDTGGRFTTAAGLVDCDVTVGSSPTGGDPGFLAEFALADSPEFTEWVAATRLLVRRTAATRRPERRRILAGAAILTLAAVLVMALRTPAPPRGFNPGDPVVLADVDNTTGDSVFDRSLAAAAAVSLRQSAQVAILPPGRIAAALRRMLVPPDRPLTLARARELAVRENVRYVVGLSIEPAGPAYLLNGRLVEAETGVVTVESQARAETRGGTLVALDRILDDLRGRLGESRGARRGATMPLPDATTPSLEALRAYASGSYAWRTGDYGTAKELWLRAIDLDSGFAMTMGALGTFFYYHHDPIEGRRYFDEALRRESRLTPIERLEIEANYAWGRRDSAAEFRARRKLIADQPTADHWSNYGTALMRVGLHEQAIAALTHAVSLDSTEVGALVNLATSARNLSRYAEAAAYYRRAGALDSTVLTSGNIGTEYGALLIRLGRIDDATGHYRSMLTAASLQNRLLALRGLGYVMLRAGHLEQAVGFFRQANLVAEQQGATGQVSLARGRMLEGMALRLSGDSAAASRAFDQAMKATENQRDPGFLALFGMGFGRAGRRQDVERMAARVGSLRDSASPGDRLGVLVLDAERMLLRHRPDSAAMIFAEVSGPLRTMALLRRASALADAGHVDQAAKVVEPLLPDPPVQHESQVEWYWTLASIADAAAAAGDTRTAARFYGQLAAGWTTGDATSPLLVKARAYRSNQ